MKRGWRERRLGEVCAFLNRGVSPKYIEDGGVCVINQRCIREHRVNYDVARRHDVAAKGVGDERYVRVGDVLVNSTGTGTLGRVAQVREAPPEPTTVDSHVTIVRPLDGLFVPEFFGYMLVAIEAQIQTAGEGCGGQTELARGTLAERFTVRYPQDSNEQRRIVGILDEAFEGIATARSNAEENLDTAYDLFASCREQALEPRPDWQAAALGELCEIKHGFAFKGEFFSDSGQHVLLTPGNFYERGGYRDRGDKQKYYVGEIPPGFILRQGDMLIAMTEQAAGLLGSPLIVPESDKFLHNQRLGLVVPRRGQPWVTSFFFHVMNLARIRKKIHDGGTGQKVRHTSPGRIHALRVFHPSEIGSQRAIAERLDELCQQSEELESVYRRKLAALDELKKSILHHAFTGQL